ncbi:MAG: hypothetical protein D9V44_05735 [Actinobacteria bacterium]|nr:MAG: hypothetical protein D9V44_05735 [Actinomycetota bacterium]
MLRGSELLHGVAERILLGYLHGKGFSDAALAGDMLDAAEGIDLTYTAAGRRTGVKIKADSYYGTDASKIADRDLIFYRSETSSYGFEAIANAATRQPGWLQRSSADELFYYRIAIAQTEEEVGALMEEPNEVFFAELKVERDSLQVLPMRALQGWFEATGDRYMSRPVVTDGRAAWYRIVPQSDVESAVAGVRDVGRVFPALIRG